MRWQMHSSECMNPRQGRQKCICFTLKYVFDKILVHACHHWEHDILLAISISDCSPPGLQHLHTCEFSASGATSGLISIFSKIRRSSKQNSCESNIRKIFSPVVLRLQNFPGPLLFRIASCNTHPHLVRRSSRSERWILDKSSIL